MLDDGYAGTEQDRMRWPFHISCVIDIERIDPDEGCSGQGKIIRRASGQKGVPSEILIRPPMHVPPGGDEDGFTRNISARKDLAGYSTAPRHIYAHDNPFKIGER